MKKRFNWIIFIIILIFFSLLTQKVFSYEETYLSNNHTLKISPDLLLNKDYGLYFSMSDLEVLSKNKVIGYSAKESSEQSCTKPIKSSINSQVSKDIYFIKSVKSPPNMINQKELKSEKIFEILNEDSNFYKTYQYAKELGFNKLNSSMETVYDNGASATISLLYNNKNKSEGGVYLVRYMLSNKTESFLIKVENNNISNTTYITFFDEDWGLTIDFFNKSKVKEWGHHSCSVGDCFLNAINYFASTTPGSICLFLCDPVCTSFYNPWTCSPCIGCLVGIFGGAIYMCNNDPCSWYPCLQDCTDLNYYGSWGYFCLNSVDRYKHRWYNAFGCEHNDPGESGSCIIDSFNSGWVDETFVESCAYGCNSATNNCNGEITCYGNATCGSDGWIGSPSCNGNDVWQTWRDYTCYNPGTQNSYCDNEETYILKQECVSGECENGECVASENCEDPNYPWWCNNDCWHCNGGDDQFSICCPNTGDPDWCCNDGGPYCDTSTGECDVCGGEYPFECNGECWSCPQGGELCCPESGDPEWCCYDEIGVVCMSDGNCCLPENETCNNQDDNCDGIIDNFNEGCGLGACGGGVRTCTGGSWSSCSTNNLVSNEVCNNIDDDCDGYIDEDLIQECGTNIGECVTGTQTCSAGMWGECDGANYIAPTNETCNGLDDNCNGVIDEANVCGDYPNATIIDPENYYVSYISQNVTFNCSFADDHNLSNITLYHSLSGNMSANETKNITGTSGSITWTINNIPDDTSFIWNCLIYDNDSHWSWSKEGPYNINISITEPPTNPTILYPNGGEIIEEYSTINWTQSIDPEGNYIIYFLQYSDNSGLNWYNLISNYGYENKLDDGSIIKEVNFSGNENQTIHLRIPKKAIVTSAKLDLTGLY